MPTLPRTARRGGDCSGRRGGPCGSARGRPRKVGIGTRRPRYAPAGAPRGGEGLGDGRRAEFAATEAPDDFVLVVAVAGHRLAPPRAGRARGGGVRLGARAFRRWTLDVRTLVRRGRRVWRARGRAVRHAVLAPRLSRILAPARPPSRRAGVVACSVMPTTPSGLTTRRLNAFRAARADLILQVGIRANHGIASSSHHRGAYSGPGQLPKRLGHPSLIRRVPRASPAALTPPPPPSRTPPARRSCDRAGKSSPPARRRPRASECVASCARRNE